LEEDTHFSLPVYREGASDGLTKRRKEREEGENTYLLFQVMLRLTLPAFFLIRGGKNPAMTDTGKGREVSVLLQKSQKKKKKGGEKGKEGTEFRRTKTKK